MEALQTRRRALELCRQSAQGAMGVCGCHSQANGGLLGACEHMEHAKSSAMSSARWSADGQPQQSAIAMCIPAMSSNQHNRSQWMTRPQAGSAPTQLA